MISELQAIVELFCYGISFIILVVFLVAILKMIKEKYFTKSTAATSFDLLVDNNNEKLYDNLAMNTFDDVAGLTELKEELKQFIAVFHEREKFKEKSVDIPRGIILYGPPGCGKTYISKAIASAANVNFLCRNASDLLNDSLGFNKIATLFETARKKAPCIIFIDELDILGSRYMGMSSGDHQSELTRLLAEMDGFQKNDGILVIGATNDISKLDKALLRSGRFSKKFYVDKPTTKEDVLAVVNKYKGNKPLSKECTDEELFKIFHGCSPADIKDILNESGIYAVLGNTEICLEDIRKVMMELTLATNLVSNANASKETLVRHAYHELGHTLVALALNMHVTEVSIRGTSSGVGGYTMMDNLEVGQNGQCNVSPTMTFKQLLSHLIVNYGGLCGETYFTHQDILDVSLGCSQDLEHASSIAYKLVSDFTQDFTFFKKSLGDECQDVADTNYVSFYLYYAQNIATIILDENKDLLVSLANQLVETEVLYESDISELKKKVRNFELTYNDINKFLSKYKERNSEL